jgi:hypothetical protein
MMDAGAGGGRLNRAVCDLEVECLRAISFFLAWSFAMRSVAWS